MLKKLGVLFLGLVLASLQRPQQKLAVGGMEVHWEFYKDTITFTAVAPDDGWIGLGFNTQDAIKGSNLFLFNHTKNGDAAMEYYVVGPGNPKPIQSMGSQEQLITYTTQEIKGHTQVTFSLPTSALDDYHFDLKPNTSIWLICAYSMEDEFEHHSRMRKHVKVTL